VTLLTTCSIVPLVMPRLVEFSVCMMMFGFVTLIELVLSSECWCIMGLRPVITSAV
jgi:hypothetical protein